jgi:hypothetical protein
MANPALGPRVLLRRLREVMAEPETAQTRLDRTVSLIAANMVAEVCSLYVMRPGGVLELYATEGLKREAVHASRLRVGEGLVGTIAASRPAAQPVGRPGAPLVQVPARDRRGDLSLLPRRADPARRPDHRRAGGAEPHRPALQRGGGRGPPDHRHGAGRDRLVGRARRGRRGGRHRCRASAQPSPQRPGAGRGHRARPCRAARAAHHHCQLHHRRRGSARRSASRRRSPRCATRWTRWWTAASSRARRNTARCWRRSACSPTTAAGCSASARRWTPG